MMDNLVKRLTAGATGAGNLPKDLYRKDCADALAEIERLRAALQKCAAGWSSSPGTVMSAAAEVNVEFQRRMQIAADAINQQQEGKE